MMGCGQQARKMILNGAVVLFRLVETLMGMISPCEILNNCVIMKRSFEENSKGLSDGNSPA